MIVFHKDPYLQETPFYSREDIDTESLAKDFLDKAIDHSRNSMVNVVTAVKSEWKNNPSTAARAVFGHWYVSAIRHLEAMNILSEVRDYSVVAHVHHRKIFEIFIQASYFANADKDRQEYYAQKMHAIGCIEYIENLKEVKDHPSIKPAYDEISESLELYDQDIVNEIIKERGERQYKWFGRTYSWLAREVSKEGENLQDVYRILSASAHGSWDLKLDVDNPEPGVLNFKGHPDERTMYLRAAEDIDQASNHLLNLWNEVARAVGAPEVKYTDQADSLGHAN